MQHTVEEAVGDEAARCISFTIAVRVEGIAFHVTLGRHGAELRVPARLDVSAVILVEMGFGFDWRLFVPCRQLCVSGG